jgi:ribosome-interacting GTPase 1
MLEFEDIKIQLIDTPPLGTQTTPWWLPPLLRRADALLIMVDLSDNPLSQLEAITEQLKQMRIVIGDAEANNEPEVTLWPKKALVIGNKLDLDRDGRSYQALLDSYKGQLPVAAISATAGNGLEELKLKIYQMLDIIRVYTKAPGQKADLTDPIVLPKDSTLDDAAASVHKDFAARLKYARIWGSGKHEGIMAKRDHTLEDGDVIELHL